MDEATAPATCPACEDRAERASRCAEEARAIMAAISAVREAESVMGGSERHMLEARVVLVQEMLAKTFLSRESLTNEALDEIHTVFDELATDWMRR